MPHRNRSRSALGTILVMWLAVACGSATATLTPTPTLWPRPAATPTTTPTLGPTATPTAAPTPTPTVGPGGFPRRFRVKGNAFVDQFGTKMIFRGIDALDPVLQKVDPRMPVWSDNYYKAIASWGANIIRVPIVPLSIHQYGMDAVLSVLDQTVAWAAKNKMYVIIDFHSVGWIPENWYPNGGDDETTAAEWTGFWKTISSHYAGNDVVAFYELFNEPALNYKTHPYPYPAAEWSIWKGYLDTLIKKTIRPNDPGKTLLVGGVLSAYDLEYVAHAPIADSSRNVAYSTHPYDWISKLNVGWDTAFGKLSSKYPVFATEYGYDSPDPGTRIGGVVYHQALIDYLEAHHISWTAWSFGDNWPPSLLKDRSTFEPTESGAYFKNRLLKLNGHPSP